MTDDNYNPFSLNGKTILVTGASSGIGRATAIECSKMGATVIITARNRERLNETLSMMSGAGHLCFTADLLVESEISRLVDFIPQVTGIVNAAGCLCLKPIKFYSSSAVENMFKLNSFASIYLVRDVIKKNKLHEKGSLVFISSIGSYLSPSFGNGIYSASKASIDAFSRQCSIELCVQKIRSNTISPGLIDTPLLQDIMADLINKGLSKFIGKPEDVARLAVYLLSDASSFVTGSSFIIDGGMSLIK